MQNILHSQNVQYIFDEMGMYVMDDIYELQILLIDKTQMKFTFL